MGAIGLVIYGEDRRDSVRIIVRSRVYVFGVYVRGLGCYLKLKLSMWGFGGSIRRLRFYLHRFNIRVWGVLLGSIVEYVCARM